MRNFQRRSDHQKSPLPDYFYLYIHFLEESLFLLPAKSFQALVWDLVKESTTGSKLKLFCIFHVAV